MIIQLLNGTQYDISDFGLGRLFHTIPSAEITHETVSVDGLGDIITATVINQRTIPVEFGFQVRDIYDYYLLRDELNALFLRSDEFYIIFKREPYKRWRVKLADQFTIPPTNRGGKFTINFRTVQKYAESIATTLSVKEWDADVWSWNGAINWDEPLRYGFDTNDFKVLNLGNAYVDPRFMTLDITVRAVTTGPLKIVNTTTGDEYQYNGGLTNDDTLTLQGVKSLKNGISVFKDTTKTLIRLAPGENNFQVTGGIVQYVGFNFRFPFK